MPVHSEFRQPRISSSSAIASRRSVRSLIGGARGHVQCPRSFTRLGKARLDRIAVDSPVLHLELVGELVDLVDRVSWDQPERDRLLSAGVLLSCVDLGEGFVWRRHGACVLERLPLSLLPEDLEDHAASASTTRSTQATSSRARRRNASRSADAGPCPVTTARSFSQSGSV